MALKYALAAFALSAASVSAQTTEDSNIYTVSGDYYNNGYTTRATRRTSMFWTATVRLQDWVSTSTYTWYTDETSTYLRTYTRTIKPTVTPTVTPTFTSTYTSAYANAEIVELYYPENAVADSDFVPTSTYDYYASTISTASTKSTYSTTAYYMPVTMTAPASCPTAFTVATQALISDVPTIIGEQLKPTSTDVSTSTMRSYVAEYNNWYLTAGAAPFTSTDNYYYKYYIASCTPPQAQSTGSSRNYGGGGGSSTGSGDDDSWPDYRACYFGSCTTLRNIIIIIATVLVGIFLLGFLESWFWYTRLMKGQSAMRCGTICWILLFLVVLCFTRMQDARSKEDQALLRQKWKEMPAGQKFKNWSWGFKRRYPVPLLGQFSEKTVGIVPEGQPLPYTMVQAPQGQVFYYGPPPQGWQPPPSGGVQGYPVPVPGHPPPGGYYAADISKGAVVGSTPVAIPLQAPQLVYHPPTSSPQNTQPPAKPQPPTPAPVIAPAPPASVSGAPASAPVPPATTQPHPAHHAAAKDQSDDLYD